MSTGEVKLYKAFEKYLPFLWLAMLVGSLSAVLYIYSGFFWPIFFAFLLYVVSRPFHVWLCAKNPKYPNLNVLVTSLLVFLFIVLPLFFTIKELALQTAFFIREMVGSFTDTNLFILFTRYPWLTELFTSEDFWWVSLINSYTEFVQEYNEIFFLSNVSAILGKTGSILIGSLTLPLSITVNLIMTAFILVVIYKNGAKASEFFFQFLPFPDWMEKKVVNKMFSDISAVLQGAFMVALMQGFFVGLAFFICDIRSPILWAAIGAFVSIIPIIGTGFVFIPGSAYLVLFRDDWGMAIFLFIFCLTTYQTLDLIVRPRLLDQKLGLHPILLFLAILGGLAKFGLLGILIGPVMVSLFKSMWDLARTVDPTKEIHDQMTDGMPKSAQ